MAQRSPTPVPLGDETLNDPDLIRILEDIEREEIPQRLLILAQLLQEKLALRKQRQDAN